MARIHCEVTEAPILPADQFAFTNERGHGAMNCFFGAVRETNHGKKVTAVAYDAFAPLAEKVLREICSEASTRWGEDLCFHIVHRTGKLSVGEVSVGIVDAEKSDAALIRLVTYAATFVD